MSGGGVGFSESEDAGNDGGESASDERDSDFFERMSRDIATSSTPREVRTPLNELSRAATSASDDG